jgi:hypothetical protein
MWLIITIAECFMLSCVMTIAGSGNISNVKDAVEDTIVQREIDASLKKRSLYYYDLASTGLADFDQYYVDDYPSEYQDAATYQASFAAWLAKKPTQASGESDADYQKDLATWQASMPTPATTAEKLYASNWNTWYAAMPKASDYSSTEAYQAAMTAWKAEEPTAAYVAAVPAVSMQRRFN